MNKWIAIPLIVLLAAGAGALGFLYFQESGKLKDADVEISSLEGNVSSLQSSLSAKDTDISSLESDLGVANASIQAQQAINTVLTDELKNIKDPRHFTSLSELVDWLDQDDTDILYASKSLEELAFILQVAALRDGYLLPACFEDWDGDYLVNNVGNLAYIGDEIFMVWPDDDTVFTWAYVAPIPSHPLPLD